MKTVPSSRWMPLGAGLVFALAACSSPQTPPNNNNNPPPPAADAAVALAQPDAAATEPPPPQHWQPTAEDQAAWEHAGTVLLFNNPANFPNNVPAARREQTVATGFTPDPHDYPMTAGGGAHPVNVADLHMKDGETGADCVGYATANPDFKFNFQAGSTFPTLRFWVTPTDRSIDTMLIINTPGAAWRCNDDHGNAEWRSEQNWHDPVVDFHNPEAGRYDIWIGTYTAERNRPCTLHVTEVESNHP